MTVLTDTIEQLQKIKPALLEKYPLKALAIFGSVSRDEATEASDVDILVEFSAPVGMEFIHLAYDLEAFLQRKVDLVSRNGIKDKYFQAIQSDLIYV
ncbi:MAG TPA: nucleotidyltransferase family protein [Saprospiraceae bacterium]|nr:nucleotidyltransferase family protein [Saprospiraceae bacterium]HMP25715.1 nucleotidyltransferase family protein [Saprospiraceae bacterium]